jgi:2-phospho-L-lactate guanylyltransferase
MLWTVVMPLNDLGRAKSRLTSATADGDQHRALVQAMRADAIRACVTASLVARIVLVSNDAELLGDPAVGGLAALGGELHVLGDPAEPGLNAAVRAGARYARRWPEDGVAALVSDLPCVTAVALDEALAAAARWPRAVVVDREGTGTTMLTAGPHTDMNPQFGAGSARRHVDSGAVSVPAAAAVRTDVDTAADLAEAESVGVGPATARVLARLSRA